MAEGDIGLYVKWARKRRGMKEILETRFQKPYWYKFPNASWQCGTLILSTSQRSFFLLTKTRFRLSVLAASYRDWSLEWVSSVCLGIRGGGKKTSDYAYLCFCDSDGRNIRMTVKSYRQIERIVCSTNVDHLKTTVKPRYNNIGLCDISYITTDILLQQLIARC